MSSTEKKVEAEEIGSTRFWILTTTWVFLMLVILLAPEDIFHTTGIAGHIDGESLNVVVVRAQAAIVVLVSYLLGVTAFLLNR
jgi:hypothetical protein